MSNLIRNNLWNPWGCLSFQTMLYALRNLSRSALVSHKTYIFPPASFLFSRLIGIISTMWCLLMAWNLFFLALYPAPWTRWVINTLLSQSSLLLDQFVSQFIHLPLIRNSVLLNLKRSILRRYIVQDKLDKKTIIHCHSQTF